MARKPDWQSRSWGLRALSVLCVGLLALTGAASASPSQEEAKSEVKPTASETSRIPVLPSTNLRKAGMVHVGAAGFITEAEPNDTPATAQALATLPVRVRATLFRSPLTAGVDVDVFSFTAGAGDRVFAATMTGFSGGSTDSQLDIIASDGTTVLETDNDDGTIAGTASNIAGLALPTAGTYYVRVRQSLVTSLSGTIRPYDLYVNVLSGTAQAEVEPNNNGGTPNPLPANGFVSGAIAAGLDNDTFSLAANAGDTIVVIMDVDPERDAPEWNGRMGIAPFNNFILVANGNVLAEANPSEALMMTVRTTGNFFIYVDEGTAPTIPGQPTFTYTLSVFVIPATVRTGCTTYTGTGGPINDLATTDFTLNITDVRTIDYLKLNFNAQHATNAAAADFDVTLLSPDGNEVFMVDDLASPATNNPPQFNMTVEDEGAVPVANFGIANGLIFSPELQGRMEFFKGMQAQGTWTLRVRDDATNAPGLLNAWSLEVCESQRPACVIPGPGETTVFSTDFEAGDGGFTHSGVPDEWERGLPAFAPITTAHSGTNAWKTDLDNTYDINSNQELLSPNINLASMTGRITLNWWHKFQFESASFDNYWVEVREVGNPASARRVFEWTGATMTRSLGSPATTVQQSAGWGLQQADISDFAGDNIEVRFHVETDFSINFAGVAVDDVSVTRCDVLSGDAISNAALTITDGQGTYFPGEELTYTIVASNAGPTQMIGANVTTDFPTDLTNVTWTCAASSGSACGAPSGSGDIDDDVNILNGGNVTYTATGTVSATASAPLVVSGAIAVPAGWIDPDPANNTATDTDQLVAATAQTLVVDDAGNDVLEPNETVIVAPTWRNIGAAPVALTGSLSNFTGPAGPTYNLPDDQADYGTVAPATNASCTGTGDCYSVNVTAGARPVTHWDSTVLETIDPTQQNTTWTLHIGNSFTDVPTSNNFYRFIETILHRGVTGGCTGTTYCPTNNTTRDAMSVFVLVAKEGPTYQPPACVEGSETFNDVPFDNGFCRWIEELARRGVVGGCGGGAFCPGNPATREQMAVFVLRTLDPNLDPPACVQGSEVFNDVPFNSPFCRWIEELARRQVVSGCGNGAYCPTDPVSREQMSVFLTVTFSLTLY